MQSDFAIAGSLGYRLVENTLLKLWYADGILDTLIETDQDTVFHFPTECSEIFRFADRLEFVKLLRGGFRTVR